MGKSTVKPCTAGIVVLVALTVWAPARADSYPPRKSGLWQITITSADSKVPPKSAQICIDDATESALMGMGGAMSKKMCSKLDVNFEGLNGTADSICKFGTSTQTTHSTIAFTGDSAYHTETTAHFDPPLNGKSDTAMTDDAKWIGPCPDTMKPGDIFMANGMKMHLDVESADQ